MDAEGIVDTVACALGLDIALLEGILLGVVIADTVASVEEDAAAVTVATALDEGSGV